MESDINLDIKKIQNISTFSLVLILIILFFIYFFIFYYPVVGDNFDFWHMATSLYIEKSGKIDPNYANAGYYIFTVIISEIANISYDVIPLLPLQSIPLILILIGIFRNITDKNDTFNLIIIAIMIVFITKFGNKSFFMYWSHGLGFVLSISVLLIAIFRYRSEPRNQPAISLILILTIISLNYISYKAAFFTISLLIGLQIIEWLYRFRLGPRFEKKTKFLTIIGIGIIYIFTFNVMFYKSIIPLTRFTSETTSGIYKLSLFFQNYRFDPMNNFYFRYPTDIRDALMIWLLLILFGLFLTIVNLSQIFIKKQNSYIRNKIIFGLVISSFSMFIIYTLLGLSDFTYIVVSSYICYVVLYTNKINSKKYRHLIFALIISLLVLNAYMTISLTKIDYYDGIRDTNYYQYLNAPSKWYINYMINMNSIESRITATDVFTGGYFSKEVAKENIPPQHAPRIFSKDNMLFIFNINNEASKSKYGAFVINYKLKSFSANDWQIFNSWSNYEPLLADNHYLNNVYSSGEIDIFIINQ